METKKAKLRNALRAAEERGYNEAMKHDIEELEAKRLAWSLATFPEATAVSSLRKAEGEIKEIEYDINNGIKRPEEYADVIMCIFDSAGRQGISVREIINAFAAKHEVNSRRKWVKNPDNSYSHVK